MTTLARKTILPKFVKTNLAEEGDSFATQINIKLACNSCASYFVRPQMTPGESNRRDGAFRWAPIEFHQYPVILCGDGTPWAEANLWILACLEDQVNPNILSFHSTSEDLTAYARYIEEYNIDWLNFPSQKLARPTYRFNGHLKHLIQNQEIAASTAKRRMGVVIRFYGWLISENVFVPEYPAWKDGDRFVNFAGHHGERVVGKVKTTDVSIRAQKQDNPYDDCINDDGKLRPMPQNEQEWLMDALISLGNTEMTLIHLFGLVTGARIQTILTFRVRDVLRENGESLQNFLRYPVGPGTGIDTKYNKQLVLHIPVWFYEMLRTYALSERAKKRRLRAIGGDTENQYVFLSIRGAPLYVAKSDRTHAEATALRHSKVGQGVRQYITDYIIPFIRRKYHPRFHYKFHDTRATFGMNLVDDRLKLVEEKKATLKEVMDFVQARMGHNSVVTTELYLSFRSRLRMVHAVQDGWEEKLERMARRAMERTDD
ncbi:site-specific integrase [Collimonas sp.]|uniref:site-specific integrase n=1 Tax=Collimonas sp. TaxID=1963772 RepID=UPI002C1DCAB9|nr:site-specific integrase [Collimonas sp.]HWW06353.1 site-specific integrase [Collimonas sp.]